MALCILAMRFLIDIYILQSICVSWENENCDFVASGVHIHPAQRRCQGNKDTLTRSHPTILIKII